MMAGSTLRTIARSSALAVIMLSGHAAAQHCDIQCEVVGCVRTPRGRRCRRRCRRRCYRPAPRYEPAPYVAPDPPARYQLPPSAPIPSPSYNPSPYSPPGPMATMSPTVLVAIVVLTMVIGVLVVAVSALRAALLRRRIRRAEADAATAQSLELTARRNAKTIDAFVQSRARHVHALGRAAADREWTRG